MSQQIHDPPPQTTDKRCLLLVKSVPCIEAQYLCSIYDLNVLPRPIHFNHRQFHLKHFTPITSLHVVVLVYRQERERRNMDEGERDEGEKGQGILHKE